MAGILHCKSPKSFGRALLGGREETVIAMFSKHSRITLASAVLSILSLVVLAAGPARAGQVVTGSISGTVIDPTGALVPDASVTVTNRDTGATLNASTSAVGAFRFSLLPIGTYNLEITKTGFQRLEIGAIRVSANIENALGSVTLQVGQASTTVEVTAAPPLIEAAQAQVTSTITGEMLQTYAGIAENEGMDFLTLTVPGVGATRDNTFSNSNGVGFSVNGIRGRSNDQQIDGQNNNDNSVTGPSIFLANPDFVQEYDITTDNFGPEYGRNSGSVVNINTKSGTNQWHGTVSGTYTASILGTLTNIDKISGLTKLLPYNQEFTGGTVGGPISKGRVFFFGGFDNQIEALSSVFTSGLLTPTPTGLAELAACYPGSASIAALTKYGPFGVGGGDPTVLPGSAVTVTTGTPPCTYQLGGVNRTLPNGFKEWDWISRLDVRATQKDWFFLRWIFQKITDFNVAFNSWNQAAGYPVNVPSISTSSLVDWTHTFNNSVLNQFRASYGRENVQFGGNTIGDTVPSQSAIGTALTNVGFTTASLMPFGPPTNSPQGRILNIYQLQDNFEYVVGKHQLKMGGNFTRQLSPNVFLPYYNGGFTYPDWATFAANTPSTVSLTVGPPSYGFREFDAFLYVGDDWKLRSNFTLNLGLTWSDFGQPGNLFHEETLKQQTGPDPFWDPSLPLSATTAPALTTAHDLFGPSVGFAWSPSRLGNGKTVIRGGYRLTYDPAYYNPFLLLATSAPVVLAQSISTPSTGLPAAPFGPEIRSEFASSVTTGVFDPRNFVRQGLSPSFGPDRVHEWSLGVQRQLAKDVAVEARYVGNHAWDLLQSINANPYIAGLAASYPGLIPDGVTPCTAPLSTVPSALGRINCDEGITAQIGNTAFSNYNALQTEFRASNLFNQLTLKSSYTWSKTLDNTSEIFSTFAAGNSVAFSQNVLNYTGQEYGISGLDFPHTWTLAFIEDIPFMRHQPGFVGHILGGWAFSGTYILQSGQPYTASQEFLNIASGGVANDAAFDFSSAGAGVETSRPFLGSLSAPAAQVGVYAGDACAALGDACSAPADELVSLNDLNTTGAVTPVSKSSVRFIANGAEADSIFGTPFGNVGRNTLRDYWTNTGNFTLFKNIKFKERATIQWHMTMNNVFNHPQYGQTEDFGVNPFIENAGIAQPFTQFATPSLTSSASDECPGTTRCIFFGLKIVF
jgi:Carboxypeptidase regulatory-like domain